VIAAAPTKADAAIAPATRSSSNPASRPITASFASRWRAACDSTQLLPTPIPQARQTTTSAGALRAAPSVAIAISATTIATAWR
jgi:hypothetical protein